MDVGEEDNQVSGATVMTKEAPPDLFVVAWAIVPDRESDDRSATRTGAGPNLPREVGIVRETVDLVKVKVGQP
jgi:hypothetical protein